MRELIMWNLITLDGCFEGERPWDLSFHELAWGEEMERFSIEQLRTADMLVFGRATYEGMAAYWQTESGEIADFMNGLPKLVCSRSLQSADWHNSTLARDGVAAVDAARKQEGGGTLLVFGSGRLSADLMRANLFDEYRLGIAPIVLGTGRRLFEGGEQRRLRLIDSRALEIGCIVARYRPAA